MDVDLTGRRGENREEREGDSMEQSLGFQSVVYFVGDGGGTFSRAVPTVPEGGAWHRHHFGTIVEFEQSLGVQRPDAVVTWPKVADGDAYRVLEAVRRRFSDVPVILLISSGIEPMRIGFDGVADPDLPDEIATALEVAIEDRMTPKLLALPSLEVRGGDDASRHSPHPIIRLSADGDVVDVNRAARLLCQSEGVPLDGWLPADHRIAARASFESGQTLANRVVSCHGHVISWTYVPDVEKGSVWAFGFDLSESMPSDHQFREAEIGESVRRMAAGISHDFNNILTVIKGYSELVLADPQLSERSHDHLEIAAQAADRAAALVARLMAFSQQQVLDRSDFDLNGLVESVLERHQELPIDHIELVRNLQGGLDRGHGDTALIVEALDSLVTNAVEAMPTGGRIRVSTRSAQTFDEGEGEARDWLVIDIEDNGRGIEARVIERIFDPYFTTRRAGRGTGLGLAAANGIIRQHGGRIEVRSEVAVGSCFTVWLPIHRR
ncbi:MAG: HAMP domain-containing sensor histidine kinase [Opitutaceae bacterium]